MDASGGRESGTVFWNVVCFRIPRTPIFHNTFHLSQLAFF